MHTGKLVLRDIPYTYFLFRNSAFILCTCPAKSCLADPQYPGKVAHKMMDIPVCLCEFCNKVLSVCGLYPVGQFLDAEILDFLSYDAPDTRDLCVIKTDPDCNICSDGNNSFNLIIRDSTMLYCRLN